MNVAGIIGGRGGNIVESLSPSGERLAVNVMTRSWDMEGKHSCVRCGCWERKVGRILESNWNQ